MPLPLVCCVSYACQHLQPSFDPFPPRLSTAPLCSPAKPNEHSALLEGAGVATHQCAPNREAELGEVLASAEPDVCIFDRFYAEEAFSFRVRERAPRALRVLDMQARLARGAELNWLEGGREWLAAVVEGGAGTH